MTLTEDLDVAGFKIVGNQIHVDSEGSIFMDLGDSDGVDDFEIRDSGGNTVFQVDSDGAVTVAGLINGADIASMKAKLDLIPQEADQTTTAKVSAAGAVMHSQIDEHLTSFSLPEDTVITDFVKTVLDSVDAASFRAAIQAEAEGALLVPDASMTVKGRVELASQDEVDAGTSTVLAITPATLANYARWADFVGEGEVVLYTHPDHGGDVASDGDGDTTIQPQAFTNKPLGVPATGDLILFSDADDDYEVKAADIIDLVGATVPVADYSTQGKIEIATQAEVDLGTDDTRAVTPATLANYAGVAGVPNATTSVIGVVELATQAETNAGLDAVRVITPEKLAGRTATEVRTGVARIATTEEVTAGVDDTTIVTPAKLAASGVGGGVAATLTETLGGLEEAKYVNPKNFVDGRMESLTFELYGKNEEIVPGTTFDLFFAPCEMDISWMHIHTWDASGLTAGTVEVAVEVDGTEALAVVDSGSQVKGGYTITHGNSPRYTDQLASRKADKNDLVSLVVTANSGGASGSGLPANYPEGLIVTVEVFMRY